MFYYIHHICMIFVNMKFTANKCTYIHSYTKEICCYEVITVSIKLDHLRVGTQCSSSLKRFVVVNGI